MLETKKIKDNIFASKLLEIPANITFKFIVNSNDERFLLIQGRYYVEKTYVSVPPYVSFQMNNNLLSFFSSIKETENKHLFETFITKINLAIKNIRKKFKKVIVLKGMGLKVNYNKALERLELKLGYSHLINVNLSQVKKSIFLKSIKNTLIVWGGKPQVGNFIDKLKKLKKQSAYKEKGFFFADSKITLKKVKKA